MEQLAQRLRARNTDSEEAVLKRLATAEKELEYAQSDANPHDKIIINDNLDKAYAELEEFVLAD
jgi:guanylate kinase